VVPKNPLSFPRLSFRDVSDIFRTANRALPRLSLSHAHSSLDNSPLLARIVQHWNQPKTLLVGILA
jgi:hypothetical protein